MCFIWTVTLEMDGHKAINCNNKIFAHILNAEEGLDGMGEESDSEGEDKSQSSKTQLQLDNWLTFSVDSEVSLNSP